MGLSFQLPPSMVDKDEDIGKAVTHVSVLP